MKLCEAETFSVFDHHYRCIGNIDTDFNHCCCYKDIEFSGSKGAHYSFLFVALQAAMQQGDSSI